MIENTKENITERLLRDIPGKYDSGVGSFPYDILEAAAIEFENCYNRQSQQLDRFFVETSSGEFLEKRVEEFGLSRKNAVTAVGKVEIIGEPGAIIRYGDIVSTGKINFKILETKTLAAEPVEVHIECTVPGKQGNVPAATITKFPATLTYINSVINNAATYGGADDETDDELRSRFGQYKSHPVTSGNQWAYVNWALEVEGVGQAKCIPLINGPGTVGVIILDAELNAADDALIEKVKYHIEEERVVGASVIVDTADCVSIEIMMKITIDGAYDFESVKMQVVDKITNYFKTIRNGGSVIYARVLAEIMSVSGIIDCTNLLLNNSEDNITIGENEIPILGGYTIE